MPSSLPSQDTQWPTARGEEVELSDFPTVATDPSNTLSEAEVRCALASLQEKDRNRVLEDARDRSNSAAAYRITKAAACVALVGVAGIVASLGAGWGLAVRRGSINARNAFLKGQAGRSTVTVTNTATATETVCPTVATLELFPRETGQTDQGVDILRNEAGGESRCSVDVEGRSTQTPDASQKPPLVPLSTTLATIYVGQTGTPTMAYYDAGLEDGEVRGRNGASSVTVTNTVMGTATVTGTVCPATGTPTLRLLARETDTRWGDEEVPRHGQIAITAADGNTTVYELVSHTGEATSLTTPTSVPSSTVVTLVVEPTPTEPPPMRAPIRDPSPFSSRSRTAMLPRVRTRMPDGPAIV
ncbi:uncharacterized protein MKK02DRAFT_39898 [Dioszegia hungarica]|uniref:Uncharacterized protein n=1 Tax=Dioszegia hungarica TaxID=4972 RepID=A0AA38HDE9_9TREE|nr:uncharacterized protein MKK02DRAFT_39898 [Dioszegia hungarica]KAI9639578.1 hypothetical protein MKK02DRAFT_39898 [Dioszegia hungarica]